MPSPCLLHNTSCFAGQAVNAMLVLVRWRIESSQGNYGDLMSIGTVSRNNLLAYSGATGLGIFGIGDARVTPRDFV